MLPVSGNPCNSNAADEAEAVVRDAIYSPNARKQTVSLTINADLYAKAKRMGINASQIAEEALAGEVERRWRDELREEARRTAEAYEAYAAEHGDFAALVRDHYAEADRDDGAV